MYPSIFLVATLLSGTTAESETTAEPWKCKDEVTNCEEVLDKMRCYEYGDQCPKVMVWNHQCIISLYIVILFLTFVHSLKIRTRTISINCCFHFIYFCPPRAVGCVMA